MKKAFLALCIVCMSITAPAAYAETVVDDAASIVTLSGTVPSGEAGVRIGVDVFCPGKGYNDLSGFEPGRFGEIFVMRNQVVSGEGGKWDLSFEIYDSPDLDYDARSGIYTAVIFPGCCEQGYSENFAYTNLVCRAKDIAANGKPGWTNNSHHDYLYINSNTAVSDYYRADFQISFGNVCKTSGTEVAWSYDGGRKFSEAASIPGNIVIYDSERAKGQRVYIGKAADLITYADAGTDCSKIVFRTRGGRLWETFSYQ